MEDVILDSLDDIGYSGRIDNDHLNEALKLGCTSPTYTSLVSFLVQHLCNFYNIHESLNPMPAEPDSNSISCFLMELSGFLREYGCPHRALVEGSPEQRLQDRQSRLLLLDYLITEYQAAQIYFTDKPQQMVTPRNIQENEEPSCATSLKQMLICLAFPKPPATITPFQLFSKVEAKLKELITKFPNAIGSPLLKAQLTSTQWDKVLHYNSKLTEEYNLRRDMLRKRLDVTIQSFLWSDRAKSRQEEAVKSYQPLQMKLKRNSVVRISDLLAARDSLLSIEKTNSNRRGAETHINKVIMGDVPDRGGRTGNMQAPPPEMPSFMKRQDSGGGGHSAGRGGGRGNRGGRVQGGWSRSGDRPGGGKGGAGRESGKKQT